MSIQALQRRGKELMARAANRYRLERLTLVRESERRESAAEIREAVRELVMSGEVSA
jgi:hypothetical protein